MTAARRSTRNKGSIFPMWSEIKTDWLTWWNSATWLRRLWPFLLVGAFWIMLFREERLSAFWGVLGAAFLGCYYFGPRTREWFYFWLPYFLTAFAYHFMAPVWQGSLFPTRSFAELERAWMGITKGDEILLPAEWLGEFVAPFQKKHTWIFTLLQYLTWLCPLWVILAGLYFRFRMVKRKNPKFTAWGLSILTPQVGWAFFGVSLLAYALYVIAPVPPPWCTAFGEKVCGTLGGPREFGGTAWWLAWMGLDKNDLLPRFSAAISFQVAYATIFLCYAFAFGAWRITSVLLLLIVCFTEIQSEGHYVLGLAVGIAAAIFMFWLISTIWRVRMRRATQLVWNPSPQFKLGKN